MPEFAKEIVTPVPERYAVNNTTIPDAMVFFFFGFWGSAPMCPKSPTF